MNNRVNFNRRSGRQHFRNKRVGKRKIQYISY